MDRKFSIALPRRVTLTIDRFDVKLYWIVGFLPLQLLPGPIVLLFQRRAKDLEDHLEFLCSTAVLVWTGRLNHVENSVNILLHPQLRGVEGFGGVGARSERTFVNAEEGDDEVCDACKDETGESIQLYTR